MNGMIVGEILNLMIGSYFVAFIGRIGNPVAKVEDIHRDGSSEKSGSPCPGDCVNRNLKLALFPIVPDSVT